MKMHLSLTVAWFVLAFLSLSKVAQQFSELQFEQGGYEVLQYGNFKEFLDHMLNISQVLASFLVKNYTDCAFKCLTNVGCLSFNFAIKPDIGTDLHSCHLLASDRFNHSTRLVPSDEFHHYTFWSLCENSPCQNGGSCRPLYENKSFVCDCLGIYYGPLCKNLKVLPSCQEIYQANRKFKSGVYELTLGSQAVPVYCQMGIDECGSGGWTTVMKIDGRKSNLGYNSQYWRNMESFNPQGGATGFDESETKLPSYWSTPFSKICLGMKVGDGTPKFILMNKTADSLYSLIADDNYRRTTLGRDTWKKLIETSSLQQHCNREGFNSICITAKARIGIHANQENDCNSCDSRIAFGGAGHPDDSNKCGNVATHNGAGDRNIKAMGYILVQ